MPELRKVAPAADVNSSSILVEYDAGKASIVGLVSIGSDWESSRRGDGYNRQSPPNALNIRIDGPGRLSVFQGGFLFAQLSEGVLSRPPTLSSTEFMGIDSYITKPGLAALQDRITPPKSEPPREYRDFEYSAYLNVIVSISNTIDAGRHGGTLILAREEQVLEKRVRAKFSMSEDELSLRFIEFMNKRNRMMDDWHRAKRVEANMRVGSYVGYRDSLSELTRTAAFVGRLAAVDGAVLVTSDLRLVGFGAEILLDGLRPVHAWELKDPHDLYRRTKKRRLDSEQYGMRHRSAMRLCGNVPDVAALVVSQDGGINAVFSYESKLYFRRNMNAVNTVMVGV